MAQEDVPYRLPRRTDEEMVAAGRAFHELMSRRRSVRRFAGKPVPRQLIELAIRTASTAPSGANRQPWRYVVVDDKAAKQAIRVECERVEVLFHQNAPAELAAWMKAQIEERKVEPNSGLGEAIAYMRNHWKELTLFLREPGAPLDNNLCERALKKAILHRKNAYLYKTTNGARVGDLFMSLIHTCELNGANPFRYLTELQKHARELAAAPCDWMPWNYLRTLESLQGRPPG